MHRTDWFGVAIGLMGGAVSMLFEDYRWVGWIMLAIGVAILLWHLGGWCISHLKGKPKVQELPRTVGILMRDSSNNQIENLKVYGADKAIELHRSHRNKFGKVEVDGDGKGKT